MNFALILFMLLVVSGALWVLDHFVASKRRSIGSKTPWWVEYGASFFPVILVVFSLRSFVVEPFKIPSGSMIPTLLVFRFPADPSLDYIKRVVGLPGDKIEYVDKKLTINGVAMPQSPAGDYLHTDRLYYSPSFTEKLGEVEHKVIVENDAPASVSCTVPAGHYFMMGDNRDGSFDSRDWGFVPEQNIVGKAFFIWFNFNDLKRIGSFH